MRQLYQAVAVPKFTYAANVWFTPITRAPGHAKASGSVSVARWCQDMDFSEKYELGLEEKSLRTFPRIR